MILDLRQDELKAEFNLFARTLAEEARKIDALESAKFAIHAAETGDGDSENDFFSTGALGPIRKKPGKSNRKSRKVWYNGGYCKYELRP